MSALAQALRDVCAELEKHDSAAPCLHYAKGLLAGTAHIAEPKSEASPIEAILAATAEAFGYTVGDLRSSRRPRPLTEARFAAMLVLRRKGESLPRIGATLLRDHTTVIHGIQRAQEIESVSEKYAEAIARIENGTVAGAILPRIDKGSASATTRSKYPEIAKAYADGASILECAAKFKVAPSTVKAAMDSEGVETRPPGGQNAADPERIERIMYLRSLGKTLHEIGCDLGVSRERIRQIVVMGGKQKEFAKRPLTPDEKAAVEEYKAGGSLALLASRMGVSTQTAKKRLTVAGVPARPSRKRLEAKAEREKLAHKIADRYVKGDDAGDIAASFGLNNKEAIYRYLGIAGVKPDRRSNSAGRLH